MASVLPGHVAKCPPAELPKSRAYFVLSGIYTGDIWHCAAAQILSEYRRKDKQPGDFPHPGFLPVTACIVYGKRSAAAGGGESDCEKKGRASYDYMRSIGLPCVVAVTEAPNAQLKYSLLKNAMDLQTLEALYRDQPADGWDWGDYDRYRKAQEDQLIPLKKAPGSDDARLLRYDVSTTILMQLIDYLGVKESLQILSVRLWKSDSQDSPDRPEIVNKAESTFAALVELIKKAQKASGGKEILLFNYRQSDKNAAYNSNERLFQHVQKQATSKHLSVIMIATGVGARSVKKFSDMGALDIYAANESRTNFIQDKRITACFWRLVASRLQIGSLVASDGAGGGMTACIRGLIGGRSGSIDIASFVGVRVISWDEPLFAPGVYHEDKKGQIVQLARLLNQRPVSFIAWYDTESVAVVPVDEVAAKKKRKLDPEERKSGAKVVLIDSKNKTAPPAEYESLQAGFLDVMVTQAAVWPVDQPSPFDPTPDVESRARLNQAIDSLSVTSLGVYPNYLNDYGKTFGVGEEAAIAKAKASLPPATLPDYTENVFLRIDDDDKLTDASFDFAPEGEFEYGEVNDGKGEDV